MFTVPDSMDIFANLLSCTPAAVATFPVETRARDVASPKKGTVVNSR